MMSTRSCAHNIDDVTKTTPSNMNHMYSAEDCYHGTFWPESGAVYEVAHSSIWTSESLMHLFRSVIDRYPNDAMPLIVYNMLSNGWMIRLWRWFK